jgi:hypothetical protein
LDLKNEVIDELGRKEAEHLKPAAGGHVEGSGEDDAAKDLAGGPGFPFE